MSVHLPPGWPDAVHPPGTGGFESTAAEWLLDLCPADYRGYRVLRQHPLALAWLAGKHVQGAERATADALSRVRSELAEDLGPGAKQALIGAIESEQARLIAAARAVGLLEQALRGHRYVPRI
jgi:hypothetical protein